jgi:thiamine biosynthesis lipoprotein ApbE
VGLEATFRELSVQLLKLHDALNSVQITVGDKPPHDEAALVDGLENTLLDMMGTLHEARTSALHARKAIGHPPDLDLARRALANCQERFQRIEQQFASELASYEKLTELARLGRTRQREWIPWASSTKQAVEQCRHPIEQTSKALTACWQELAERAGNVNISMKSTSVGQQIKLARAGAENLEVEGAT